MNRSLRVMAEHCAECADAPSAAREAAREALAPRRSKLKPNSQRPSKLARESKQAERRERVGHIRDAVRNRSGGACEVPGCHEPAEEMHHILYGSGLRRSMEDERTCIDACEEHHHLAHRNDLPTLSNMLAWARNRLYGLAAAALEHRISKVCRIRSQTPSLRSRA